ncbi:peptidoglycan D,D-transpeptidase FtsI family protein [Cucumibacter marinus]|uniref:peptidoglycan D,D-transpeptidase FtsI family protein n=1 Tax=Cucumibacter marinus TaxID=1121252 RepID=UPI0003FE7626|nr:penicillin-binding protein 2 [Cucumibacter marinus]
MSDAAFSASGSPITIEGVQKARGALTRNRIKLALLFASLLFVVILGRLALLAMETVEDDFVGQERPALTASRPTLLDRNGQQLAIDIQSPSLFAEPRNIVDLDEAVEKISRVLPDLDRKFLRERLDGDEGFVWLQRELTPAQQDSIMRLGLPGIDFVTETRRFYPGGPVASHILGAVNVDNVGIAGIEAYLDREEVALLQDLGLARDRTLEPKNLSIDLRVQHAMHRELKDALERYQAIASAGVMIDVRTGEIIAMASLPDFDPNDPASALEEGRYNRITAGTFELGSTFKTVTISGALDSSAVSITDRFDATSAVRFGRFSIGDFHGKNRVLSVPEVYKYSSNIGTIKIMQAWGKDNYRAYLHKLHLDGTPTIELPEKKTANVPKTFSEVGAATASFGHGLSVTPLQLVAAYAAIANGGTYIPPTLFKRDPIDAQILGEQVISKRASDDMRYLLRLNALEGSGRRAAPDGYMVGGKTGTAEKVVDGRYSSAKSLAVFASVFPMDSPRYAMVILVDEPQPENERSGRTAAWNAGDVTGRIIERVAPMLGVLPDFDENRDVALVPAALQ